MIATFGRRVMVLGLLAVAGCGKVSNSAASIASACQTVAEARCSQQSSCSLPDGTTGVGFSLLDNYGDRATCIGRQVLACTNGLNAPQTGNSPAKVQMCAMDLPSLSCADFFDNTPPADCAPTGPRQNGASCTFAGQCASGYCGGTKATICGTCADPPVAGADCTATTCDHGQRCVGATTLCETVVALNGTCDSGHPCDRGLTCVGENAAQMISGTCETAGARVGVPCGGTMPGCDPTQGLYCAGPAGAKTCMQVIYPGYNGTLVAGADGGAAMGTDAGVASDAGVATTPPGTPCGVLADGSHVGCVAGNCYTATGLATGQDQGSCKPLANDGQSCDLTVGPACMPPARCVVAAEGGTSGTCIVPSATSCP
jgi:hypothetical protein